MSYVLGAVTLPYNPTKVTVKQVANAKAITLLAQSPLILSFGPKNKIISIEGDIAGDTAANLETNYLIPLEDMAGREGGFHYVIYDDDETIWTAYNAGVGAYTIAVAEETTIVHTGQSSLKITIGAGASATVRFYELYSANKDWSEKDFVSIWWYGTSSNKTFRFVVSTDANNDGTTGANYGYYEILDDAAGWERFQPRLDQFTTAGTFDWTVCRKLIGYITDANPTGTFYMDRTVIGIGQYLSAPNTRYDGIYFVNAFTFEERGGYARYFPYKIELWDEDDYF